MNGETLAQVENDLVQELCISRVDDGGAQVEPDSDGTTPNLAAASSTSGSVSVTAPTISFDSQARVYYGISYWKWIKDNWASEINACPNCNKTIGGTDGFATAYSQALNMKGYSATAYGDTPIYPSIWQVTGPSGANSNGAGYQFQDRGGCHVTPTGNCQMEINVRRGQEVVTFLGLGGCKTVQGFATYGHSWSSTRVSGFGINSSGASISWTTSSNQWTRASQPGPAARVC